MKKYFQYFGGFEGIWQQKFVWSHLKEIQTKTYRSYYKIFISVLLREIFLPKSTNCPPSSNNF